MTRQEFFDMKAAGALWDVGVSINRTNPLPLDKNAVFESYDAALTYAKGVLSYPGQFIAVVAEDGSVTGYMITVAGGDGATLQKLAAQTATGDVVADLAALTTRVGSLETSVGEIKTEIGAKKEGETAATGIYKYVDDAVAAATPEGYAGVKADVTKLVGDDKGTDGRANKTVREIASEEVAKIVNGADASFDTLKEVSDWISTHGTDAATMNTQIGENKAAIEKLNGTAATAGSVANTVNTAIDSALKVDGKDKYALATELTTANGKITALETKTAGLTDAEGADMTVKAYVDAGDAKVDAKVAALSTKVDNLGKLSAKDEVAEADLAASLKTKIDGKADKATTLAGYGITDAYTKSGADDAISEAIDALKLGTMAKETATDYSKTTVLVGDADNDTKDSNTFVGVRKYADDKASTALSDAKAYADGLVTGDGGITKRVETLEGKHATGKTVADEVTAGIDALNLAGTYAKITHKHDMDDIDGLDAALNTKATTEAVNVHVDALNTKIGTLPEGMSVGEYVSTVAEDFSSAKAGLESDLNAVDAKIGTVPAGKTVVAMIEDAKTEATYDDATVKAGIADNKAKIEVLNGTESVDGSVKKTVKDAINDFATKVSDDQTINTFKELVDYAASHSAEYSTLAGEVQKNTGDISTLNGEGTGSVKKTVADAITAIGIGDYAKTADVEAGYVAKETGKSLVSDTEITKLGKLTGDEQANVIEAIKVAGASADLAISEKKVTIPFATEASAGVVKASEEIAVATDGKMSLTKVSTDLLFNGTNELILNGGEI